MPRWRAPGRVNLIGEHTDYNDGFVLPIALQLGVTATVIPRTDSRLALTSAQAPEDRVEVAMADLAPGSVHGWAAYAAGVVWSLRRHGYSGGGADIHVDGDVPAGSGLSSSAALACAVAAALAEAWDLHVSRKELVQVARRAENDFVGVPTGIMDQSASLLASAGHALFVDARSLQTRQVPFDIDRHGLALLVIDTHTSHALVDGEYAIRRRACEQAATLLQVTALRDVPLDGSSARLATVSDPVIRRRARHVVTENARVLDAVAMLDADRPRALGPLLTASHESMRDDFEITAPAVDLAQSTALEAGALGARMTGGGFGGCVIALVEASGPRSAVSVDAAVARAFDDASFEPPSSFIAIASTGARPV